MFIAAFSGSVAIMAAVNTPIEWFSRLAGFLTIILLIGYLKISPIFEDAIHSGWMKEIVKTSTENSNRSKVANAIYYAALGIFISLVYFVGGFVQRKIFLEEKYEERIRPSERAGLYIFILIEIILVFILYFVCVVYDNYKKSVVIIWVFILGNFWFYLVAYAITSSKLDDTQYLLSDTRPEKGRDMSYLAVIGDPKFIGLFLPSLIVVGTTYAVYYNIIEKATIVF